MGIQPCGMYDTNQDVRHTSASSGDAEPDMTNMIVSQLNSACFGLSQGALKNGVPGIALSLSTLTTDAAAGGAVGGAANPACCSRATRFARFTLVAKAGKSATTSNWLRQPTCRLKSKVVGFAAYCSDAYCSYCSYYWLFVVISCRPTTHLSADFDTTVFIAATYSKYRYGHYS